MTPVSRLRNVILVIVLTLPVTTLAQDSPYEQPDYPGPVTRLDRVHQAALAKHGFKPARCSSDGVFLRRLCLDVLGRTPTSAEFKRFKAEDPNKRRKLAIDYVLDQPDFGTYWALRYSDVLRLKSEFPVNVWPNGVQAYYRFILEALQENRSYDAFSRQLLTSSGSNFRQPAVNFYRATQGNTPDAIADAVALTFLGARVEKWTPEQRQNLEQFFKRVAFKRTAEWKEEIVYLNPEPVEPFEAIFPDGSKATIPPGQDPREVFADWLIWRGNPLFAKVAVNRIWAWVMGRGLVHEPDDFHPDNPSVLPEVLDYLEEMFVASGYDQRALLRVILNSRAYQQSPLPLEANAKADQYFACYNVRSLDAEVLLDSLTEIKGGGMLYISQIPEPFTFFPEHKRSIELYDGSITNSFLLMFGRPSRNRGLASERVREPNDDQRLFMLNSSKLHEAIQQNSTIQQFIRENQDNKAKIINGIYEHTFYRLPTKAERTAAAAHIQGKGHSFDRSVQDLIWALFNTKEFLTQH